MSLDTLFFAPDLFVNTAAPEVNSAWRCLHLGDADGAESFAERIDASVVEAATRAQIRAAVALVRGQGEEALAILCANSGLAQGRRQADLSFQAALCAEALGHVSQADNAYDVAVAGHGDRVDTWLARADFLWRAKGVEIGRLAYQQAAAAVSTPALWCAWARHERQTSIETALTVIAQGLRAFPDHPDILNMCAAYHLASKHYQATIDVLARLPASFQTHPIVLSNLGNAALGLRQFARAKTLFQAASAAEPDLFEPHLGAAMTAYCQGDDAVAEPALRRVLALRPGHQEAEIALALTLTRQNRIDEAVTVLEQRLQRDPSCHEAHYQLAVIAYTFDRYELSEIHTRKTLELTPDAIELYDLLGLLLQHRGRMDEALTCFARGKDAVLLRSPDFFSNWLYAGHYDETVTPDSAFHAHLAYGARFGGQGDDLSWRFANPPQPDRRLKIGYVSPDFRAHSVAFFMMAPVLFHDRAQFEVIAYSNARRQDMATDWFSGSVDTWRDIRHMIPDEIRAQIREDQIDILVDLAGHTGGNLLPIFARRAAPVQVSYLGYPDTTGVPAMDYRLVDAVTDPDGVADAFASERLIRLPKTFLCYTPSHDLPPVAVGPVSSGYPLTFGSFNAAMKLNGRVLAAWGRILSALPDAHLILKAKHFSCQEARQRVLDSLRDWGVSAERVSFFDFMPTLGEHLNLYGRMDLALDAFPYNGTTTTCEALAMGVPVLTVKGDRHSARVGESLLHSTGLDGLFLAEDDDDYVAKAIAWGKRRDDLAQMRTRVRESLFASPLCDGPAFVTALEDAYRRMWRAWCAGTHARCGLEESPFARDLRAKECGPI